MKITQEEIFMYCDTLAIDERSSGTIAKYRRDLLSFCQWLNGREVTREAATEWKESLVEAGYAPRTVNSMLAAVHGFCRHMGWGIQIKYLRVQHRAFRDPRQDLTRDEYLRLINTAEATGKHRLALMIETLGATGIRISELKYITVEAATAGITTISLKGKIRTILLPDKLCRKLLRYAKKQKTATGEIFLTRSGRGITRKQAWYEMKQLCKAANVAPTKVFPHNMRHLFARVFYQACKDIARLADVLGHSSMETTRIYLAGTGEHHRKQLEALRLVT